MGKEKLCQTFKKNKTLANKSFLSLSQAVQLKYLQHFQYFYKKNCLYLENLKYLSMPRSKSF